MTVEKAKAIIHTTTRQPEIAPRVAPMLERTSAIPEVYADGSGTDTRMARAVRGQSRTVSKNTSHIPRSPALAGSPSKRECASEDVPAPASFESKPRENPSRKAVPVRNPMMPPLAESAEKALQKIEEIALGMREGTENIVTNARKTYKTVAVGIIIEVNVPTRSAPKIITASTKEVKAMPTASGGIEKYSAEPITPRDCNAAPIINDRSRQATA